MCRTARDVRKLADQSRVSQPVARIVPAGGFAKRSLTRWERRERDAGRGFDEIDSELAVLGYLSFFVSVGM